MLSANRFALKEWAAVCAALAGGRQIALLRKGGIHEGPAGFEPEQREFWLFPTRFHQNADELRPDAHALLREVAESAPPDGVLRLAHYALVDGVWHLPAPDRIPALSALTVLSPETVTERFHYRRPGLWVLTLRVYALPAPCDLVDEPRYAGCHSWVELTQAVSTSGLRPVLDDQQFQRARECVAEALADRRIEPETTAVL